MNITSIIQLFQTPTCIILSLVLLVFACGFVFKNLHFSSKDLKIDAKSKKKRKNRKK